MNNKVTKEEANSFLDMKRKGASINETNDESRKITEALLNQS